MITDPKNVCPKRQVVKKFDFHPWFGVYVTAELVKKQIDDGIVTYVNWYFDYNVSVNSQKTTLLNSIVFNYCKEKSLPVPSFFNYKLRTNTAKRKKRLVRLSPHSNVGSVSNLHHAERLFV